jgi:hypothetical protein
MHNRFGMPPRAFKFETDLGGRLGAMSSAQDFDKCRQILGHQSPVADRDLERLRSEMYGLVGVAVSTFSDRKIAGGKSRFEVAL